MKFSIIPRYYEDVGLELAIVKNPLLHTQSTHTRTHTKEKSTGVASKSPQCNGGNQQGGVTSNGFHDANVIKLIMTVMRKKFPIAPTHNLGIEPPLEL